jgi:thymidylate synthase (FAD)
LKAEYIDHLGDDLRVVNAARVSFDKESYWDIESEEAWLDHDGELELVDKDKKLINYLARHGHWTPFSHPQITLRETVPIFVARQRFKHMVGFSYNEVSRRYVDSPPEFYYPESWYKRPENKIKQGRSEEEHEENIALDYNYREFILQVEGYYNNLIEMGVAPEQARIVLPQSMYTSYYVTGSLAAWSRAYKLRSTSDAMKEIRELSNQWDSILKPLFPVSWLALTQQGTAPAMELVTTNKASVEVVTAM